MSKNSPKMPSVVGGDYVSVDSLRPHPDNPRGEIDPKSEAIQQLARDIDNRNVIQPLVVTPEGLVLCGHRRLVAARLVGLKSVPVVVRKLREGEFAQEIFLAENLQRQDLTPLEEARAFFQLRESIGGATAAEMARRTSVDRRTITLRLFILQTTERVQQLFHRFELPSYSSEALARLRDYPEEQERVADLLVTHRLTGKQLPALVDKRLAELKNEAPSAKPKTRAIGNKRENAAGSSVSRSRQATIAALNENPNRRISLHNLKVMMESICCHCGMVGNEEVCGTCPMLKLLDGSLGRAD